MVLALDPCLAGFVRLSPQRCAGAAPLAVLGGLLEEVERAMWTRVAGMVARLVLAGLVAAGCLGRCFPDGIPPGWGW